MYLEGGNSPWGTAGSLGCRRAFLREAGTQCLVVACESQVLGSLRELSLLVDGDLRGPSHLHSRAEGLELSPPRRGSSLIPSLVAGFECVHSTTRDLGLGTHWRRPPEGPWVVGSGPGPRSFSPVDLCFLFTEMPPWW